MQLQNACYSVYLLDIRAILKDGSWNRDECAHILWGKKHTNISIFQINFSSLKDTRYTWSKILVKFVDKKIYKKCEWYFLTKGPWMGKVISKFKGVTRVEIENGTFSSSATRWHFPPWLHLSLYGPLVKNCIVQTLIQREMIEISNKT